MKAVLQGLVLSLLVLTAASGVVQAADFNALRQALAQARQQGDLAKADLLASDYLAQAQAAAQTQPNRQAAQTELALAYQQLGQNAMERNDYPLARRQLEQSVGLLASGADPKALADSLRLLGMNYRYQTDYPKALEHVYRALQLYQKLADNAAIASAYGSVGTILEKMGQYEAALQAHQQELALYHQLGEQQHIAGVIYNLANLNRTLGDTGQALRYFLQALQLDEASADQRNIAYSHNKLAFLYSDLGEHDKAEMHVQQALVLFEKIGAKRDLDWARSTAAKVAMEQGDFATAQQLLNGVIRRAKTNSYHSLLVDAYKLAAELAVRRQDDVAALGFIDAGIAQARLNQELGDEAQLQQLRVQTLIRQDQPRAALAALLAQKQLDEQIFSSKRAGAIAALQAQTEFTRQQHQLEMLQNEQKLQQTRLEQQQLMRNFWLCGSAAGVMLLFLLYRRYLQLRQNRALEQQVSVRTEELQQKNAELQTAYQQLEAISLTDQLTGLANRHFLESQIERELEQYRRQWRDWQSGKTGNPAHGALAVFLIDLDHFKALNDRYGHHAGDEVLQQLKARLQQVFRLSDFLVRWGGEEFVVVARQINRTEAGLLAGRLVQQVAQTPFILSGQLPLPVSCSVGYACYPLPLGDDNSQHWPALLRLADLCLYAAKYSGRNGWVGLEDVSTELPALTTAVVAQQLQTWQQQGLLQLQSSYTELHWLGTAASRPS